MNSKCCLIPSSTTPNALSSDLFKVLQRLLYGHRVSVSGEMYPVGLCPAVSNYNHISWTPHAHAIQCRMIEGPNEANPL